MAAAVDFPAAEAAAAPDNNQVFKERITMGLFKSNKNPCPICGGATPRLFPRKVEGQPLCKECDNTISMEDSLKKELTLVALREHLDYRKQNAELHKAFSQSRVIDFNNALFLKKRICIDDAQGLWYLEEGENPPIFHIDDMVSFRFKEDARVVIQLDKNGYKTHPSVVDSFAKQYGGVVGGLYAFSNTLNRLDGNKDNDKNEPKIYAPISTFHLEFTVNNEYWKILQHNFGAPGLVNNDIPGFLRNYSCARAIVDDASQELLSLFPGAPAQGAADEGTDISTADLADDLKKFKDLWDMGIITQAEFDAKKKLLLGL
ncbi:MAG: SHOCT domain-containing protein [Acetanaerobacterium sp.]